MTYSAIAQQRLASKHITSEPFEQPADVVRWLGALQAQDYAGAKSAIGLRIQHSTTALTSALQGGNQLTRDQLRGVLAQARIATSGEMRTSYLLMHAELEGILGNGARQGKQFTYTLLSEAESQAVAVDSVCRISSAASAAGALFFHTGHIRIA